MAVAPSSAVREPPLRPQSGPQVMFLSTPADIAIYGGAAGSGKTFALLLEALRSTPVNPKFDSVIFRRTTPQIRNPGGLWSESVSVFGRDKRAIPTQHNLEWVWRGGGMCKFAHLEHEKTVLDWHGSQVAYFGLDELTTFTQYQFFYLMSRMRSMSGVSGYMRCTCNPDPESWVAEFISWWIDPETGFPIKERAGVLRWFLRVGDDLVWASDPKELDPVKLKLPRLDSEGRVIPYQPISVTFIPATIYDNQELIKNDPQYLAWLMGLPLVEKERLLRGNWKIRPAKGLLFSRSWVEVVDEVPADLYVKRGWDLAATPKTQDNDPDWTCGTKLGHSPSTKLYYVLHHFWMRGTPQEVEASLANVASGDGPACEVHLPQDPGQAGKSQTAYMAQKLSSYTVRFTPETGDKVTRFGPFSSQAQVGNVKVLRGPWNERWFSQLEGFPDLAHDDDVDSTSRAFNAFVGNATGLIDYYQKLAEEKRMRLIEAEKENEAPTMDNGGVLVQRPKGSQVNMLHDQKGRTIFCDEHGRFVVTQIHAGQLYKLGFSKVDP